ncbi:CENP-B homolog protein 2-like [Solanum dulcamara]|uniref:CENP-B homolog protein 2-like n=1 Tax=Solanum dulcamara TaxID=45834 RepID=UPI0024859AB1|nr:CENP-B homolog protein 2-like [Solanum dulcamara]
MSSHHLKGIQKSSLTNKIRNAICEYKKENPTISQKDLQAWVKQKFDLTISQITISRTLKKSAEYLSNEMKNSDAKRHQPAKYPDLEKILYQWFLQMQEKVNMSGKIIQGKAKNLFLKMYGETNPEFSFSSGWLEHFKSRYRIKSYRRFGESGSVIMENIENELPSIRSKLDQFELKDIYNMDETELFYQLEADHSLAIKQLEGRKKDKERITLALCCNDDGSEKVICKFANPRCFKNVNMNNLNCMYRSNKKVGMTGLLFQEYIGWFDKRMNGRKILLIVDNCPAHPKIVEGLRNVELFFLPPNTTSKIQSCDAGIIRAFKAHYRRRLYFSILQGLGVEAPNTKKINILNAINFANLAWNFDVKEITITNCFRHCKIRSKENSVPEPQVGELDEGIQVLNDFISNLAYRNVMDVEHLLNYPNENDTVMESPTKEEIIQFVMNNDDENDPEQDDSSIVPHVLLKETFQLDQLLEFINVVLNAPGWFDVQIQPLDHKFRIYFHYYSIITMLNAPINAKTGCLHFRLIIGSNFQRRGPPSHQDASNGVVVLHDSPPVGEICPDVFSKASRDKNVIYVVQTRPVAA